MVRAWMVRAGVEGERERPSLEQGRVLAGWPGLGDLHGATNLQAIREELRRAYGPDENNRTIGSWAGQLWRFRSEMRVGDVVVMPLRQVSTGAVAIGRITGEYQFDPEAPEGCQHFRSATWGRKDFPRDLLGPDLRASLGALTTVCELSRNKAASRLQAVLETGEDPEAPPMGEAAVDEYLGEVARKVEEGQPEVTTVRELLGRWQFFRRTASSVDTVNEGLSSYGLLAVPGLTDGGIDDHIHLVADPAETKLPGADAPTDVAADAGASAEEVSTAQRVSEDVSSGEVRYAVSSLPSANCTVLTASADTPLARAVTQMARHSYSQLAVVDAEHRLLGALTWESIALAWASGRPQDVRDAMVRAQSVAASEELLGLTPRIYEHGYVFVREAGGRVQGIVTASDLTKKFGDDHAPIVQLDEIEKRLAAHVTDRCTDDDLRSNDVYVRAGGKTMGTYVTAMKQGPLWEKLGWHGVDQEMMCDLMDQVRRIRNDIMHFSPDPITAEELEVLASAMRTLRMITADPE